MSVFCNSQLPVSIGTYKKIEAGERMTFKSCCNVQALTATCLHECSLSGVTRNG